MTDKVKLRKLVRLREQGNYSSCIQLITNILTHPRPVGESLKRSLVALRSDCYLDTEQWSKAIADLSLLLGEKQESALYANRGLAYWYLKELDVAFRDFQRAIRMDRTDAAALRNMGRLQIQRGKTRSGLIFLRRAVAVAPKDATGRVLLGDAFAEESKWVQACHEYVAALKVDPTNKRALLQIRKIEQFVGE